MANRIPSTKGTKESRCSFDEKTEKIEDSNPLIGVVTKKRGLGPH